MESPEDKPVSDNDKYKDVVSGIEDAVTQSLDIFDKKKSELLDALEARALGQDGYFSSETFDMQICEDVCRAYELFVAAAIDCSEDDAATGSLLAVIYRAEKEERVRMLNSLIGVEALTTYNNEDVDLAYDTIFKKNGSADKALKDIIKFYSYDLVDDVRIYVDIDEADSLPDEEEENIHSSNPDKSIKDHIVDAAKIASGVFLALAADKLIKKVKYQD